MSNDKNKTLDPKVIKIVALVLHVLSEPIQALRKEGYINLLYLIDDFPGLLM